MKYKEELKERLGAAIDNLSDSEGFVLVASADNISFTPLSAGGWDEHVLELEPLVGAITRQEHERIRQSIWELEKQEKSLTTKISVKKRELRQIEAAIARATGAQGPPQS